MFIYEQAVAVFPWALFPQFEREQVGADSEKFYFRIDTNSDMEHIEKNEPV